MTFSFVFLFLYVFTCLRALENKKRVLVLLQDDILRYTHSQFFHSLASRGFSLTYTTVDEHNVAFEQYGDFTFDHLVIFTATEDFGKSLNVHTVLNFIDDGSNVIFASDSYGLAAIDLASECGIEIEKGDLVYDHFNNVNVGEDVAIKIPSSNIISTDVVAGNSKDTDYILFKGTNQKIKKMVATLLS